MPRLFTGSSIPSDLACDLGMLRGGISGAAGSTPIVIISRFASSAISTMRRRAMSAARWKDPPAGLHRDAGGTRFLRRRQAPRHHRQGEAGGASRRAPGRAGTADAAYRHSARTAQIHPAHHARAAARRFQRGRRRLSDDARFLLAPLRGDTICFVLGALCHRRRALSGRGGLSAGVNLAKTARRIISFTGAAT